eukprot:6260706-Amphidinium_carterae.1
MLEAVRDTFSEVTTPCKGARGFRVACRRQGVGLSVSKTKATRPGLWGRSRLSLSAPARGVTGVSWASCWLQLRDGLELPLREPADHHSWGHFLDSSHLSRMVDLYGRDHQAPAFRELAELLRGMREKIFFRDHTRSGRFATALAQPEVEIQVDSDTEASLVEQAWIRVLMNRSLMIKVRLWL